MNLFSLLRDCFSRVFERKITLIVLVCLFFVATVLGVLFITTPAIYSYHLNLCDRFVDRVCYSETSVFLIFLERLAGNCVFVAVILCSGVHVVGLFLPPIVLVYRAYTFGGSLAIFFSVYKISGVLIVFALYLPIHLLIDAVLIGATVLSFSRARCFCFTQEDILGLLRDFLILIVLIAAICLLECILLAVLFHPIGELM